MASVKRQLELIEEGRANGRCSDCISGYCGKRDTDSIGHVYVHGCFRAGSPRLYTSERAEVIEAPEKGKI